MSLHSAISVAPADLNGLVGAFATVAERSFFAFAEPAMDASADAPMSEWTGATPYVATVSFKGPRSGVVALVVPEGLARELTSAFLGLDFESDLDETSVQDLVGEMANMATGSWLSGLEANECFELAHPDVSRTPGESGDAGWAIVLVNGTPIGLCCHFTETR